MDALRTGKGLFHKTVVLLSIVPGWVIVAVLISLLVVSANWLISPLGTLIAVGGVCFLLLLFVKPEVGLFFIFLLLPFHLAVKKYVPGPAGTYWKEGLLLLSWIASLVNGVVRKRLPIPRSRIWLPLVVFCSIILTRFLLSDDHFFGAWGLYVYFMYLPLLFIIFWRTKSVHQLKLYIWLVMLTSIISAIGGIAEFLFGFTTGLQNLPAWWISSTHIRRVTFTFDAPMPLGSFLAVGLCLFITFWLTYPGSKKQSLFFLSGTLVSGLGLIFTFSRGPTIQAIGSLAYIGLVYFLSLPNATIRVKWLRKIFLLSICITALVTSVLLVAMGDKLLAYLRSFFEWSKSINVGVAAANAVRIRRWQRSLEVFLQYPLEGIGLGMTGATTSRFFPNALITESFPLKILLEAGLPALMAFFWLYLRLVRDGTRMALSSGRSVQRALAFGASAGLVGIFIEGLVLQILETKQISAEFWLFIAILIWLEARWRVNARRAYSS